jgi:hypothetical protein
MVTLEADLRVVASGQRPPMLLSPIVRSLLIDGGDVYWHDGDGALFVERQADARVIELLNDADRGTPSQRYTVRGIAVSADRLYASDGFLPRGGIDTSARDFRPPSRLLSLSKQDGSVEVLLDRNDITLVPIAADAERVIVYGQGRDPGDLGYFQVRLADPQLEPLPLAAPFQQSQLLGDQLYWLDDDHPPRLLRSGFDDAEPETVMTMYGNDDDFVYVGPDHILSLETRILPGLINAGRDFVVSDDSSCRAFPGPRKRIMVDTALDGQYAYWYGVPGASIQSSTSAQLALYRVDLESGATTQLNTPGFSPELDVRILAQDDTRLFLRGGSTLVELQKP